MTPSVAAPGDTDPSDATVAYHCSTQKNSLDIFYSAKRLYLN